MNLAIAIFWTIVGGYGFAFSIVIDLRHRPLRRKHIVHALFVAVVAAWALGTIWWFEVLK